MIKMVEIHFFLRVCVCVYKRASDSNFFLFLKKKLNRDERYKDADREKDIERGRRDRQKEQVTLLHMIVLKVLPSRLKSHNQLARNL